MYRMNEWTQCMWLLAYTLIHYPMHFWEDWNVPLRPKCTGLALILHFISHLPVFWNILTLNGRCCATLVLLPSPSLDMYRQRSSILRRNLGSYQFEGECWKWGDNLFWALGLSFLSVLCMFHIYFIFYYISPISCSHVPIYQTLYCTFFILIFYVLARTPLSHLSTKPLRWACYFTVFYLYSFST